MSSEMGDNHGNFDLFRLDSSVRIKTRIYAEVTWNRTCANAHNSGNYETTPWLRSPASIVARRVITLIMRLGT